MIVRPKDLKTSGDWTAQTEASPLPEETEAQAIARIEGNTFYVPAAVTDLWNNGNITVNGQTPSRLPVGPDGLSITGETEAAVWERLSRFGESGEPLVMQWTPVSEKAAEWIMHVSNAKVVLEGGEDRDEYTEHDLTPWERAYINDVDAAHSRRVDAGVLTDKEKALIRNLKANESPVPLAFKQYVAAGLVEGDGKIFQEGPDNQMIAHLQAVKDLTVHAAPGRVAKAVTSWMNEASGGKPVSLPTEGQGERMPLQLEDAHLDDIERTTREARENNRRLAAEAARAEGEVQSPEPIGSWKADIISR